MRLLCNMSPFLNFLPFGECWSDNVINYLAVGTISYLKIDYSAFVIEWLKEVQFV